MVPAIIRGHASQSVDIFRVTNSTATEHRIRTNSLGHTAFGFTSDMTDLRATLHVAVDSDLATPSGGAIMGDAYGDSVLAAVAFRRARGLRGSPTAINAANFTLTGITGAGYHSGGSFQGAPTGSLEFFSRESFTSGSQATAFQIHTTPTGSTSRVPRLTISEAGFVGIGLDGATAGPYGAMASNRLHVVDTGTFQVAIAPNVGTSTFLALGVNTSGRVLMGSGGSANCFVFESQSGSIANPYVAIYSTGAQFRIGTATSNYTQFTMPAGSATISYTLPGSSANGFMRNAASTLSWSSIDLGTGDVTGDLPYSNLAQGSARSILGVAGNATADVASVQSSAAGQVPFSTSTSWAWTSLSSAGIVAGSGTTNALAKWTGTNTLGDSGISDSGSVLTSSRVAQWSGQHRFDASSSDPLLLALLSSAKVGISVDATSMSFVPQLGEVTDVYFTGFTRIQARRGTNNDAIILLPRNGGTNGYLGSITTAALTNDRTYTMPDATGTVALTADKLSVFAATTSAELAGVISDENGFSSGEKLIFAAGTLAITSTKTLTATNSLTLSGTDSTTMTFPTTNATIARTDAAQTFTGVQTFSAQDVHTLGIDLSTSGVITSQVANSGTNAGLTYQPSVAYTPGTGRFNHIWKNSAGTVLLCNKDDSTWEFGASATTGGYITCNVSTTEAKGINFIAVNVGAGASVFGVSSAYLGGLFRAQDLSGATATSLVGATFHGNGTLTSINYAGIWGGWFRGESNVAVSALTEAGGWKVFGNTLGAHSIGKPTTWYGGYVQASGGAVTSAYGLYLEQQTAAGTNNIGIFLANATSTYKAICIRDTSAWIGSSAANRIDIGATEFLVQSTKLGFFNTAPVVKSAAYTPTNVTTDRSYDANSTTLDEVADVLGTLIGDLQAYGLIA